MKRTLFVIPLLLAITLSACQIPGLSRFRMPDDGPPIAVSETAAQSFREKLQVAAAEAQTTGATTITITEEEITSFLALEAAQAEAAGSQSALPISDLQIYFQPSGEVVVRGNAEFEGQTQPIRVAGRPVVMNEQLDIDITSGRIGPLPVPQTLLDRVEGELVRAILAGQEYGQVTEVRVEDGTLTLSGQSGR